LNTEQTVDTVKDDAKIKNIECCGLKYFIAPQVEKEA
jgi:hypothetical protein